MNSRIGLGNSQICLGNSKICLGKSRIRLGNSRLSLNICFKRVLLISRSQQPDTLLKQVPKGDDRGEESDYPKN